MRPFVSKFQIPEIPMPIIGASIGITVTVENVNKVDIRRTVNGKALVVQSPFPRRAKIVVEASGRAIQAQPAFRQIQLGDPCTVYSPMTETAYILPGQASVTVDHDVVPGSNAYAHDQRGNVVPAVVNGRTISVPSAPAGAVKVLWYPVFYCVLASHSGSANEVEGAQTWRGELEERG